MLADDVCMNEGWPILLVLNELVRGGEELGRLFPCEVPFFEFFLGELCWKQTHITNGVLTIDGSTKGNHKLGLKISVCAIERCTQSNYYMYTCTPTIIKIIKTY